MSDTVSLLDIRALARQESARMHHFFIGVEHFFIALTQLEGGLMAAVLEHHGLSPQFVRYSIRETVGRYENRRYWPGFPESPRLTSVLALAQRCAGEQVVTERDLLLAIVDEPDSVVARVLHEMGADRTTLRQTVANWVSPLRSQVPEIPVRGDIDLDSDQQYVLKKMFRDYSEVQIVRELDGGYSGARVLLVRPTRVGGQHDAPVVVKLDDRYAILYERRRYDRYVKGTLPAATARLIDAPVVPDQSWCAGLKYTFVGQVEDTEPVSLRELAKRGDAQRVGDLIRGLFDVFGPTWWRQRQSYRFGAWREYEHVLPPALVVEVLPDAQLGTTGQILTPRGRWSRYNQVLPGEIVALKGFAIQKLNVEQGVLHLATGAQPDAINRSGKVEVRGLELTGGVFFRGEQIEQIVGRVISTRDDLLLRSLKELEPNFDLRWDYVPSGHALMPDLPNPLTAVTALLERQVSGCLSTIHGDMHLGNVLVGPRGDAWLIDFAWTREGHTLFDWALLEVSLLVEVVSRLAVPGWDGAWEVIGRLDVMGRGDKYVLNEQYPVDQGLLAVMAVREVVQDCLAVTGRWHEYYIALALLALRIMSWQSEPVDGRRLAFLMAAWATAAVQSRDGQRGDRLSQTDTTDRDKTDLQGDY